MAYGDEKNKITHTFFSTKRLRFWLEAFRLNLKHVRRAFANLFVVIEKVSSQNITILLDSSNMNIAFLRTNGWLCFN